MQKYHRAVIVANGTLENDTWLTSYLDPHDYLIAVDGGSTHLKRLGTTPHLLIGDLDSLDVSDRDQLAEKGCEIIVYPAQKDETDLELAIQVTISKGFRKIRIVAALGGRIDQTLANMYLLSSDSLKGYDIRIVDGNAEIFIVQDQETIAGQPGDIVSLLPLGVPATGVTTKELLYPLYGETLYPEHSRGLSNQLTAESASVWLEKGCLLCIHFFQH